MKLQPFTISLHVYAETEEEAKVLERELLDMVKEKYDKGIYVRAAALSNLVRRYGGNAIVNNFIR